LYAYGNLTCFGLLRHEEFVRSTVCRLPDPS
jgi:hypothetical protein